MGSSSDHNRDAVDARDHQQRCGHPRGDADRLWDIGRRGDDHIDGVVATWRTAHPDWDFTGMALLGRVSRIERLLEVRRLEVERLLAVENDALAELPRTAVDQFVGDLHRLLTSLDD